MKTRPHPAVDRLRGAVVVYLIVTFFVVIVLLSDAELQLAIPWVDVVLHKIVPIAVVVDWLLAPPPSRIDAGTAAAWLKFPAAWLTLTLLRGADRRLVSLSLPRPRQRRLRGRWVDVRRHPRRHGRRLRVDGHRRQRAAVSTLKHTTAHSPLHSPNVSPLLPHSVFMVWIARCCVRALRHDDHTRAPMKLHVFRFTLGSCVRT